MHGNYGTSYYVAPEVLPPINSYDEKADIWSVGVILYIMLSGQPPFAGKNDQEIVEAVKKGEFSTDGPAWSSISDSAKSLVKSMLAVNPKSRISAKDALSHAWIQEMTGGSN